MTKTIRLSEWVTPRRYCNTVYDQSQGRRPSTLKCIGPISKGDIEPNHPSEINPNSDSRSRSDGRSRRFVQYRVDQSQGQRPRSLLFFHHLRVLKCELHRSLIYTIKNGVENQRKYLSQNRTVNFYMMFEEQYNRILFAHNFRSVISTFSWGAKFFLFFNATGLLKNWKKQHFICSNLTLFIVPFFHSFFFSFFFFFLFFLFFSFFFFLGGRRPPAPLK